MEFPISFLLGETQTLLTFGASYARGSYDDHNTVALLHFPAESTEETVFSFRLTEDMSGVDILREQLTVRAFVWGRQIEMCQWGRESVIKGMYKQVTGRCGM